MATSTLAPVTSFLPLPVDCTCMMARWITRWKPSVGWVSTSEVPGTVGVLSDTKLVSVLRRSSILTAQARSTSAAEGLSSSASSRCSTVMNSWRACRASTNAMCRLTSSSCAIISVFLHDARQRMLVLTCICDDLLDLGGCDVPWENAAHTNALSVDFEHDPCCLFTVFAKEFLDHGHHEVHRGEVVVKEHDFEQGWRFDPRYLSFKDRFFLLFDDHATHSKQAR